MDEKKLIESVLSALRSAGASGDAFLEHRRSLTIQIREGRLEEITRAEVFGVGIRAMLDGRLGFVHTSAADPKTVTRAVETACDLARSGSPRDDLLLADAAGPGDGSDEGAGLGLYDASIEKQSLGEKEEWARASESVARGFDPKIRRTEGASYREDLGAYWLGNTNGLFRHCKRSHINVGLQVIAEDQGEMQPGEVGIDVVRASDLPDPGEFGRRAGERAVRLLGGRPVPTGRYPIVFSREVGWTLLVYLTQAMNGGNISRGRSWLTDRGETPIGSPLVTILDDALEPRGPARTPYDGEGVNAQKTLLVESGMIRGKLLDLASAKRLGASSTGNAQRGGYEGLPEIGGTNLYMVPGKARVDEIVAGIDKGFWVWGLSGWWIGLDPSNPRFSSAAFGLWIEGGKVVRPVARVTIAGAIDEILTGVDQVADDLVWEGSVQTPTFRVASMAVSGV